MLKIKFTFLFIFLSVFILTGCNDSPNDVGLGLIPASDGIDLVSWNSLQNPIFEQSATVEDTISLSYSKDVLLGSYNDAKSYLLVKFLISLPDSITTALSSDSLTFVDSWLSSDITYKLGDGTSLDFTAHKITSDWNASKFTKDSLTSLQFDPQDVYLSQELTDSTFKFNIQPDAAKDWLMHSVNSTDFNNYGLYLEPNANGNLILGFPALTASLSSKRLQLTCVTKIIGSQFSDTLKFYTSADVHLVERPLPNVSNRMVLQAGTGVRSRLYFDLSSFPKNTVINRATLKIYYDINEAEFGTNKSDTLILKMLSDSTLGTINTSVGTTYLFEDSTKYSGEITSFVQKWVDSTSVNEGLLLKLSDEDVTANQLLLYSPTFPDSLKRPQLEILYTKMR